MVAQGLCGKDGDQIFAAGGFPSAWGGERQVRRIPGRQRHYGPGDRYREQSRKSGLVQELRQPGGAGLERSRGRAGPSEGRDGVNRDCRWRKLSHSRMRLSFWRHRASFLEWAPREERKGSAQIEQAPSADLQSTVS